VGVEREKQLQRKECGGWGFGGAKSVSDDKAAKTVRKVGGETIIET
jgi:hypothetical protein